MLRIDSHHATVVTNLRTGDRLVFSGNAPEEAVCAAYAMSVGRSGDVARAVSVFGNMVTHGGMSVACGDFAAMTEDGKRTFLERKARRAMEISLRSGQDIAYDFAGDRFVLRSSGRDTAGARPAEVERLEALNAEICWLAGAGHPEATPQQLADYDRIMADRADDVRAALDAAVRADKGRSRTYIRGVADAFDRTLNHPRGSSGGEVQIPPVCI